MLKQVRICLEKLFSAGSIYAISIYVHWPVKRDSCGVYLHKLNSLLKKSNPSRLSLQLRLSTGTRYLNLLAWSNFKKQTKYQKTNQETKQNKKTVFKTFIKQQGLLQTQETNMVNPTTVSVSCPDRLSRPHRDQGDAANMKPRRLLLCRRWSWESEQSKAGRLHRKEERSAQGNDSRDGQKVPLKYVAEYWSAHVY